MKIIATALTQGLLAGAITIPAYYDTAVGRECIKAKCVTHWNKLLKELTKTEKITKMEKNINRQNRNNNELEVTSAQITKEYIHEMTSDTFKSEMKKHVISQYCV